MTKSGACAAVAAAVLTGCAGTREGARAAAPAAGIVEALAVKQPGALDWKPKEVLPKGAFGALLHGRLEEGPFDFFGKFPAGYTVPLHWHTNEVTVVMMRGSMVIGRPSQRDVEVEEGGFFVLPAKMQYMAHCERECMFLVHGERAFDILYANAADDPRGRK